MADDSFDAVRDWYKKTLKNSDWEEQNDAYYNLGYCTDKQGNSTGVPTYTTTLNFHLKDFSGKLKALAMVQINDYDRACKGIETYTGKTAITLLVGTDNPLLFDKTERPNLKPETSPSSSDREEIVTSGCTILPYKADVNKNGNIGLSDIIKILQKWGSVSDNDAEDINSDGKVDFSDFVSILKNWGNKLPEVVTSWQGIIPGQTSKQEVISKLGQPKEDINENDWEKLSYPSDRNLFYHWITINKTNDKIVLVYYVVPENENLSINQYLQKYGQPEKVMYSNFSQYIKVAIYPDIGIAVWFDEKSCKVIFIRWFEPMSFKDFIKNYGDGLSEKNPYIM